MPDGTLADSSKLQQVRDVIMQIREEIKPLAKLDGTSKGFLSQFLSKPPLPHEPAMTLGRL